MSALDGLCSRCGEDQRQGRSTLCHSCLADNAAKAAVTRRKRGGANGWMNMSALRRDTVVVCPECGSELDLAHASLHAYQAHHIYVYREQCAVYFAPVRR